MKNDMKQTSALRRSLTSLGSTLSGTGITLLLVMIFAAILIAAAGASPFAAFREIIVGAFGSKRMFGETIVKMCPLLLAGLGLTITFRAGLSSVGAEGQIVIGGLMTTIVALQMPETMSPYVAVPICLIAGGLGGAVWSAIPGILKAKMGTSELVNTVMMNYLATFLLSWMLSDVIKEPDGFYPQSAQVPESTRIATLMSGSRIHYGIFVALALAFVVYWMLWRTPLGYQMRLSGFNKSAAIYVGIPQARNIVLSMALHGFFSGLAGAVEILAVQYRCIAGFSNNVGFDGIAVSLLGKNHPVGVIISSFGLAALRSGSGNMQRTLQVPASLISVIQGLIICLVLMDTYFKKKGTSLFKWIASKFTKKEAA